MNEQQFLNKLQERAREQEKIIKGMFLPKLFTSVSFWFGNHPWRILIPLAFILTLILHYSIGKRYDELILKIFGKI
ncbi:MAG: hypothetical protein A3H17_03785 [Candidatus Levybacteria bacterium RIFCSPLOWO2_12_FULL_37_14]|nr:MAG: hypothetical protein US55_C0032G0012 [Candidatus Levybacteria bacterium GW2011_GWC2_37_7]KKQ41726.1 MAG: hypothetical protein US59_C0023G0011 [Candidatus Levybacteria bacterium GW2011_GWB1_37_8]OGH51394.1 MAG: hypothetical protein A3H17_03785 [Candidatus Levybacteria bacterium RIFCSPLOWO2_12_FULL_37_14]